MTRTTNLGVLTPSAEGGKSLRIPFNSMKVVALHRLRSWYREWRLGQLPPMPYRARLCQGAAWRRAFPGVPKEEVREFLEAFVRAFAFRSSSRLNFAPDDSILAIYRTLYPNRWTPDSLEVESFAKQVEHHYRIRFAKVWHDRLTLGELFGVAQLVRGCP
jgi:propanediol dehydratase small subunit